MDNSELLTLREKIKECLILTFNISIEDINKTYIIQYGFISGPKIGGKNMLYCNSLFDLITQLNFIDKNGSIDKNSIIVTTE